MVSLDHGVDDDVPEVAGAGLARDAGHLGLVLHDEAPLDRQHIQNLKKEFGIYAQSWLKKVCPRLRDFASWRSGKITQPRTHFFANSVVADLNMIHAYFDNNN